MPRKKVGVVEAVPRRINNQENTNNSKTISKVNIIYRTSPKDVVIRGKLICRLVIIF